MTPFCAILCMGKYYSRFIALNSHFFAETHLFRYFYFVFARAIKAFSLRIYLIRLRFFYFSLFLTHLRFEFIGSDETLDDFAEI